MTFERGFERDPMGSYLESLDGWRGSIRRWCSPDTGRPSPRGRGGRRRSRAERRRRLDEVREFVETGARTVTELTDAPAPRPMSGAQRHFVMAELLADLAYHEVRGVLERNRRADGVFVWSAVG